MRDGIKDKAEKRAAGKAAIHNTIANLQEKYTKEELIAIRDGIKEKAKGAAGKTAG